jgi:anti-sigma factor ChrR (cupin superfamily)
MHDSIHGDLSARVIVDAKTLSWMSSPSGTVWRKRLHLVGPPESGQVTSVVRLLNPEGFRHSPFSLDGCLLFVKLRQFPGRDRRHVIIDTGILGWQGTQRREFKHLYSQRGYEDSMRIERWRPGSHLGELRYPAGAELFVLRGAFEDEQGFYGTHTWLRFPAPSRRRPRTADGCELYVKEGGISYLRAA